MKIIAPERGYQALLAICEEHLSVYGTLICHWRRSLLCRSRNRQSDLRLTRILPCTTVEPFPPNQIRLSSNQATTGSQEHRHRLPRKGASMHKQFLISNSFGIPPIQIGRELL
jgi:hypothetical protein